MNKVCCLMLVLLNGLGLFAQPAALDQYNIKWLSPSKNSGESMPCGGGDIGLNVWVENGDLLLYISRSGSFDENNILLKSGRVRVKLSPNPLKDVPFVQELRLRDGNITIEAGDKLKTTIKVWVDVFEPVIHVEIKNSRAITAEASFESWRHRDRYPKGKELNASSWKWAPQGEAVTYKDSINFIDNGVLFYHQNRDKSVFDVTVKQQGLDAVKTELFNPLENLIFGGKLTCLGMKPAGTNEGKYADTDYRGWTLKSETAQKDYHLKIYLQTSNGSLNGWHQQLRTLQAKSRKNEKKTLSANQKWWANFWSRSHIFINSQDSLKWQMARNYQLMRYMLACNSRGNYPTKFNGGLFTYDPSFTDSTLKFSPDFRNWGGGTHTAQNQRLVYWPMLKSGDFDLMKPQFNFYLSILKNAELRSKVYWGHKGGSFTEQIENFGLPNPAEYNWKRPVDFDKGIEHNAWLEYEWDTVLEFCLMMLEQESYNNEDISGYIPFIESCLTFFNEHYQYQAKKRGSKAFDGNGYLILYPGSAAETYKMAYNASSTIAALKTVLTRLLALPDNQLSPERKKAWQEMLKRIPPINFREVNGHPTISPAKLWERVNNTESPQLYPVFPWGIYGIGKPGLDTAINTYKYDTDVLKFRSHVGWKQDNIFAARLGLTEEAVRLNVLKLKDSGRRFPAFWGPGFDWTPDHNWGGAGMVGLQEMLMQCVDDKIYLFPAWPKTDDSSFKLHASYNTVVEAELKNGKVRILKVTPESRRKDVILPSW